MTIFRARVIQTGILIWNSEDLFGNQRVSPEDAEREILQSISCGDLHYESDHMRVEVEEVSEAEIVAALRMAVASR